MEVNKQQTNIPDFEVAGQVAVVTGGAGVLCSAMCRTLAAKGVKVAVLDLRPQAAMDFALELAGYGVETLGIGCNVLDRDSVEGAAREVKQRFGQVDILINGAGGNHPRATTSAEKTFFDLLPDDLRGVFDLNILGIILPSQSFGKLMAEQGRGVILNISSMNAFRPLTRIPAYSAAKAGVSNFTQWLAVHLAQEYNPNIRVNAIAPGFFVSAQNEKMLYNEDGSLTSRGQKIIDHTPAGRFGLPEDLLGAMLWLVSPAASFVTGTVIPIDGGFSAFSGV